MESKNRAWESKNGEQKYRGSKSESKNGEQKYRESKSESKTVFQPVRKNALRNAGRNTETIDFIVFHTKEICSPYLLSRLVGFFSTLQFR